MYGDDKAYRASDLLNMGKQQTGKHIVACPVLLDLTFSPFFISYLSLYSLWNLTVEFWPILAKQVMPVWLSWVSNVNGPEMSVKENLQYLRCYNLCTIKTNTKLWLQYTGMKMEHKCIAQYLNEIYKITFYPTILGNQFDGWYSNSLWTDIPRQLTKST